jgi:hypothetical protein
MARKLRGEYEGAISRGIDRGDRREPIFRDDSDRRLFSETFGQACAKTDWQVRAYGHLTSETTMTLTWIAGRLRMGTKAHLVHLLYWDSRQKKK